MLKMFILLGLILIVFLVSVCFFLFKRKDSKKDDDSTPSETIYPMW